MYFRVFLGKKGTGGADERDGGGSEGINANDGNDDSDENVLPRFVEDAMADIAVVFGWTPEEMEPMPIEELMQWRERARVRVEVDKNGK